MALTINNLSKKFGKKIIFENFNYTFPEHGAFVIKGDSGVGKTTLLRTVAGLDKSYVGSISGYDKREVSFCFQEYRLFPNLTALENLTQIAFENATDAEIESAKNLLRELRFSDEDMSLCPDELSGGMKQRISFARALLKSSKILLLDEVTKELDSELTDKVLTLIFEAAKSKLVLLVSHRPEDGEKINATTIKL